MRLEGSVPCVIFGFNRPACLRKVLNCLKFQDVVRLIIFIDGPRSAGEQSAVEQCRVIAEKVDWADKECHFQQTNQGLSAFISHIDRVFEGNDAAVFLEDDCHPMPFFYEFMRQSLDHYRGHEEVFSIGGYQPISNSFFKGYPYSLVASPRFMCWGWASWKDRWLAIREYIKNYSKLFDGLTRVPDIAGEDLPKMAVTTRSRKRVSWDIKVSVAMLRLEMVQMLPAVSLVKNVGLGTGTHKTYTAFRILWRVFLQQRNLYTRREMNIIWPPLAGINSDYTRRYREFVISVNQPLQRQIRQFFIETFRNR